MSCLSNRRPLTYPSAQTCRYTKVFAFRALWTFTVSRQDRTAVMTQTTRTAPPLPSSLYSPISSIPAPSGCLTREMTSYGTRKSRFPPRRRRRKLPSATMRGFGSSPQTARLRRSCFPSELPSVMPTRKSRFPPRRRRRKLPSATMPGVGSSPYIALAPAGPNFLKRPAPQVAYTTRWVWGVVDGIREGRWQSACPAARLSDTWPRYTTPSIFSRYALLT
ncbi:hypothetical protein C8R44DRAFT_324319 [Mycena epipterygia]|nr:hypothetical protein C8R44DRAFT_324319 [Mycena epipterygia]